jgi:hypothetical protein
MDIQNIRKKIAKELYERKPNRGYTMWEKFHDFMPDESDFEEADNFMSKVLGLIPAEIAALNDGGHLCVQTKDQTLPLMPDCAFESYSFNEVLDKCRITQMNMLHDNFVRVVERKRDENCD